MKRNEGYLENIRLVDYKNIYLDHIIDISKLTNAQWNVPLNLKDNEKTEINGFLPLFRKE